MLLTGVLLTTVLLTADPEEHRVEVPDGVGQLSPLEEAGILGATPPAPLPDRLVRELDPAVGQQILDIARAEAE